MRLQMQDLDRLITIAKHLKAEGSRPDLAAALTRTVTRLAGQHSGEYQTYMVLTHSQIQTEIPYQMVCEVRDGAKWDTFTRKRRWAEEFTPAERAAATGLFKQANHWTLKTGVPNSVRMTEGIFDLWRKLGDFCASL